MPPPLPPAVLLVIVLFRMTRLSLVTWMNSETAPPSDAAEFPDSVLWVMLPEALQ